MLISNFGVYNAGHPNFNSGRVGQIQKALKEYAETNNLDISENDINDLNYLCE